MNLRNKINNVVLYFEENLFLYKGSDTRIVWNYSPFLFSISCVLISQPFLPSSLFVCHTKQVWFRFHIWLTSIAWLLLCSLGVTCHAWQTATQSVTHRKEKKKIGFHILIGYPPAGMCVWAQQEECYFWTCVVVEHICACQHKLIQVVAWLQIQIGLTECTYSQSFSLSIPTFFIMHVYNKFDNVCWWVWWAAAFHIKEKHCQLKMYIVVNVERYISGLEQRYVWNVKKRVLPTDI